MLKSGKYDFIFLGAGCASLSLLLRLLKKGILRGKKVLLLDKEPKTKNDRTWCFWEKEPGFFEDIVYKQWDKISILSDEQRAIFEKEWELCISIPHEIVGRIRATLYRRNAHPELSIRFCGEKIRTREELGLPAKLEDFARKPKYEKPCGPELTGP